MLAATVATLSSASKRPAPSSASPSGTTLAQGSQSQPPQRSHTCQNSSPPAPVRPNRHRFCPCYSVLDEVQDKVQESTHSLSNQPSIVPSDLEGQIRGHQASAHREPAGLPGGHD